MRTIAKAGALFLLIFGLGRPVEAGPTPPTRVDPAINRSSCTPWRVLPIPTEEPEGITGIDGVSGSDFWAVEENAIPYHPTILHWAGHRFIRAPVELKEGDLKGLDVISASDAWAVGHLIDHGLTQALRWNGSVWQPIPVPTPEGGIYDTLYAVSANGSSDVWAVGAADYTHGLTAHWDGTAWTVVPHPRHRNGEEFRGVLTLSSDDAWAVGGQGVFSNEGPLIEHWDGSSWSDVSIPQPEHGGLLLGVDAAGPNDVWAVGLQYAFGTLIYRWNGIEWTMLTKVPYPSTGQLRGVSVISHNDLWVAGLIDAGGPPIAAHWDGSNWKITPVKVGNQWFESVKAFTHTTIWAGGGGAYGVIAARFAGCR